MNRFVADIFNSDLNIYKWIGFIINLRDLVIFIQTLTPAATPQELIFEISFLGTPYTLRGTRPPNFKSLGPVA